MKSGPHPFLQWKCLRNIVCVMSWSKKNLELQIKAKDLLVKLSGVKVLMKPMTIKWIVLFLLYEVNWFWSTQLFYHTTRVQFTLQLTRRLLNTCISVNNIIMRNTVYSWLVSMSETYVSQDIHCKKIHNESWWFAYIKVMHCIWEHEILCVKTTLESFSKMGHEKRSSSWSKMWS